MQAHHNVGPGQHTERAVECVCITHDVDVAQLVIWQIQNYMYIYYVYLNCSMLTF